MILIFETLTGSRLSGDAGAGHPDSVGLGRAGAARTEAVGGGRAGGGGGDVGRETDGTLPGLSPGQNISHALIVFTKIS